MELREAPGTQSGSASRTVRRALARAESGKTLSVREVADLLASRGDDLERLMQLASRLRDLGHGDRVTYSRKVFVPLTMLCRDRCHYCTFAKPPARVTAPFVAPDEVLDIVPAGQRAGRKQALVSLVDKPEERQPTARRGREER